MPKQDREIANILEMLFQQAKLQHGDAVRHRWFHDEEACPGCGGEVTFKKYKKRNTISLNAFFYRDHKVVIAYLLCGKCSAQIFKESETNPYTKLPIHGEIEGNLKKAFVKHLGH